MAFILARLFKSWFFTTSVQSLIIAAAIITQSPSTTFGFIILYIKLGIPTKAIDSIIQQNTEVPNNAQVLFVISNFCTLNMMLFPKFQPIQMIYEEFYLNTVASGMGKTIGYTKSVGHSKKDFND